MGAPREKERGRRIGVEGPYRTAGVRSAVDVDDDDGPVDDDLTAILAAFWLVSVVRVAGAVVRHEAFLAEASMALCAVVLLPWLWCRRA